MNEEEKSKKILLKNWVAFKVLIDSVIDDMGGYMGWDDPNKAPDINYVIEKFSRYVLSQKEDEYKWGIHPAIYKRVYQAFDNYKLELDKWEKRAANELTEDDYYAGYVERRWPKNMEEWSEELINDEMVKDD